LEYTSDTAFEARAASGFTGSVGSIVHPSITVVIEAVAALHAGRIGDSITAVSGYYSIYTTCSNAVVARLTKVTDVGLVYESVAVIILAIAGFILRERRVAGFKPATDATLDTVATDCVAASIGCLVNNVVTVVIDSVADLVSAKGWGRVRGKGGVIGKSINKTGIARKIGIDCRLRRAFVDGFTVRAGIESGRCCIAISKGVYGRSI